MLLDIGPRRHRGHATPSQGDKKATSPVTRARSRWTQLAASVDRQFLDALPIVGPRISPHLFESFNDFFGRELVAPQRRIELFPTERHRHRRSRPRTYGIRRDAGICAVVAQIVDENPPRSFLLRQRRNEVSRTLRYHRVRKCPRELETRCPIGLRRKR